MPATNSICPKDGSLKLVRCATSPSRAVLLVLLLLLLVPASTTDAKVPARIAARRQHALCKLMSMSECQNVLANKAAKSHKR